MYVFYDDTITIPYGDSAEIGITLEENSSPYMLSANEKISIDIMHPTDGNIISTGSGKEQSQQGVVSVIVSPRSSMLWRGKYPCYVRLENTAKGTADTLLGYNDPLFVEVV